MPSSGRYHIRMERVFVIILMEVLVTSMITEVSADCHGDGAATFKLVLQSQRNATGHRNVKVHLQSRATPGNKADDLGGVEAWQSVQNCDGVEIFDTVAIVTLPAVQQHTQKKAPPVRIRLPDYEVFPGLGYYKFHTKSVTWDKAFSTCASEGAHLLFLTSEAEAQVVRQILNRKVTVEAASWSGTAWAGFHDRGVEGDYRTVLGGPLNETGYTKWSSGEPDNGPWGTEPDQDCGAFKITALLHTSPCLAKLPFICKQPI